MPGIAFLMSFAQDFQNLLEAGFFGGKQYEIVEHQVGCFIQEAYFAVKFSFGD